MNTVGFIGTGNMAKAIISGVYSNKICMRIMGYDINNNNYDVFNKMGVVICSSIEELIKKCEYIVLSIKPQNFPEVLESIKPVLTENHVLISIAAGITEEYISNTLGFSPRFFQVMPNTPLLIGKGSTAIAKGRTADDDAFNFVKKLFSISGKTFVIPIEKMNEIIAINGSSPAYIYMFAKGFLNFAKEKGIDEESALNLFCASLEGSAEMLLNSGKDPDQLIKDVSSPGGTTLAGLSVLEANHFVEVLEKTCEQTFKRALELSK